MLVEIKKSFNDFTQYLGFEDEFVDTNRAYLETLHNVCEARHIETGWEYCLSGDFGVFLGVL